MGLVYAGLGAITIWLEIHLGSNAMGRFMPPDWSAKEDPVPYAQLDDPQSLNLYSYVRNNPLVRTDPDGHCCEELLGIATDAVEDFALSHPEVVNAVVGPLVESASADAAEGVAGSVVGGCEIGAWAPRWGCGCDDISEGS
jgi:hypothetical protein